jgi:uroporphyrinogen-III synthase
VADQSANSLRGKRVVVTRAPEQSRELVHALEAHGAIPVLLPMLAFAPSDDPALLDASIRAIVQYDWLFLTSQNALHALQARSEALGISLPDALRRIHVAAVGPATAQAAEQAGLKVEYVTEKHQGTAMAEELAENVKGKRVLLPRSDRANPDLVRRLEALGATVEEVVAYKTVRPNKEDVQQIEQIATDTVDAVLFFSPSAAHHFEELLGSAKFIALSGRAVFAAIGPITEEALRKANAERVILARDTTVDAVLQVLVRYFSATAAKLPVGAKPQ